MQLVALGDDEAEIIRVAVPGDPKVAQADMVQIDGLTVQAWEMEGRWGMSFRCAGVHAATERQSGPAQKAAA